MGFLPFRNLDDIATAVDVLILAGTDGLKRSTYKISRSVLLPMMWSESVAIHTLVNFLRKYKPYLLL